MSQRSVRFGIYLVILTIFEAALTLYPGRILITGHEGDLLQMIDAGLRMANGEIPHIDFMTPIGILGIAPIALFFSLGSAAGQAAILANILVCALLLPATWWVGITRFPGKLLWVFGAVIVVLCTALVHGGGSQAIALSMYYNRWCWAVMLIILAVLLFPNHTGKGEKWLEPVIIGVGMSLLALTKMTFFIPMAAAILLILAVQQRWRLALVSVLVGVLVMVGVVALLGIEFVTAYSQNLLTVAKGGAGRSYPGYDITGILSTPEMLPATIALLGAVVFLRKTGRAEQGLYLLILSPAFIYITYQNWGNDPKWLLFLILYLAAYPPVARSRTFLSLPARQAGVGLIAIAATTIAPSAFSLIGSTSRAGFASFSKALPIGEPAVLADLWMPQDRINIVRKTHPFIDLSISDGLDVGEINPDFYAPDCEIQGGYIAFARSLAAELGAIEALRGRQILIADLLNVAWLFDDVTRLDDAATWYYGDKSGFDAADYVLVPICPQHLTSRKAMLEQLGETDWQFDLSYQSDLMNLYQIIR